MKKMKNTRNYKEAMKKAEDKAGNYSFSEHTSEYKAQSCTLIKET